MTLTVICLLLAFALAAMDSNAWGWFLLAAILLG